MSKDEEFAELVKPLQEAHAAATNNAELAFSKRIDEYKNPTYPDTNYWDKYGPIITAFARRQFYDQQEAQLAEELTQIDAEFLLRMEQAESEFYS